MKKLHLIAIVCIVMTLGELIIRFIVDYRFNYVVFVTQLIVIAALMLYFTMFFVKLVNKIEIKLGIKFVDQKN